MIDLMEGRAAAFIEEFHSSNYGMKGYVFDGQLTNKSISSFSSFSFIKGGLVFFFNWTMNEQGLWNGNNEDCWNGIKPR